MSHFTSNLASAARYPLGLHASPLGARPAKTLELYDFEACPFCRKAREALTMLDLEVLVKPCPRGGTRFRPEAIARGGKRMFPLLVDPNVDPNEDELLYESDAIVAHLYARYGAGPAPLALRLGPITDALSSLASGARVTHGRAARPSRAPEKPLELWSRELSPYCRLVREALCEYELPYVLHNMPRGTSRHAAFVERAGKLQLPYLEDPNTGTRMFESRDIVAYLARTYGA